MLKINIVLIGALLLSQVLIGNFVASEGVGFARIMAERQKLEGENRYLETEIFKASSLATISAQAAKIGLGPTRTVYLGPELPVALNISR